MHLDPNNLFHTNPIESIEQMATSHSRSPFVLRDLLAHIHTLLARGLSTDSDINIIIGALTIVIGILSAILAWATWRLTRDRRRQRHGHESTIDEIPSQIPITKPSMTSLTTSGPPIDEPTLNIPPPGPQLGYELAVRFGRRL